MNQLEIEVARHYGDPDLQTRILAGLEATGIDLSQLQADDLSPIEEFHIGGRQSTQYALQQMALKPEQHLLDVGCGIGGAARFIASQIGCRVSGIDLTPEYIETAHTLTKMVGLDHKVKFDVASALEMPFLDQTFDAAITLHVAMNISQREELYREIARVLMPGATFCVFDVMQGNNDEIQFPVPWSESPDTSHLTSPEDMRHLLESSGFDVHKVDDRSNFAIEFFEQNIAAAANLSPALGVHLIMGDSAKEKLHNVKSGIENGSLIPVQIIATRQTKTT